MVTIIYINYLEYLVKNEIIKHPSKAQIVGSKEHTNINIRTRSILIMSQMNGTEKYNPKLQMTEYRNKILSLKLGNNWPKEMNPYLGIRLAGRPAEAGHTA